MRRTLRPRPIGWRTLACLAVGALGCGQEWRPQAYVEDLRVLAIRAEPPDLAPGEATQLTALVVDPSAPSRQNTLVWLACDPDPASLEQPACAKYATLQDPTELADLSQLPAGVQVLGMGPEVSYRAPAELFAPLGADDVLRRKGVLAIVLLMAVGAPPPPTFPPTPEEMQALMEKVRNKEVASRLALKRLRISEDLPRNRNPAVAGVRLAGELWTGGLRPYKVRPGQALELAGVAREDAAEPYRQLDADGQWVEKTEKPVFSYLSTVGELETPRAEAGSPLEQSLYVPLLFDPLPADRRATLYLVLRDGRGGADWLVRGLYVCDPFAEPAAITSIEPASGPPQTTVAVRGTGLDRAIDVQIGSGFLAGGRYDAALQAYVGAVPSDATPGAQRLAVRGASCRPDPELAFVVTPPAP